VVRDAGAIPMVLHIQLTVLGVLTAYCTGVPSITTN